jgi:hypothetical protein
LTVSWSNPLSDGGSAITGFKLFINPLDDGDWSIAYDGSGHPTIHVITIDNLKEGMYYRFKYTSLNYVGESAESTESTLLCAATPSAPSAPRRVTSTISEVTIEWDAPSMSGGALIEIYQIFFKRASNAEADWYMVG